MLSYWTCSANHKMWGKTHFIWLRKLRHAHDWRKWLTQKMCFLFNYYFFRSRQISHYCNVERLTITSLWMMTYFPRWGFSPDKILNFRQNYKLQFFGTIWNVKKQQLIYVNREYVNKITVKPGHNRAGYQIVAVVDRWSLFRDTIIL